MRSAVSAARASSSDAGGARLEQQQLGHEACCSGEHRVRIAGCGCAVCTGRERAGRGRRSLTSRDGVAGGASCQHVAQAARSAATAAITKWQRSVLGVGCQVRTHLRRPPALDRRRQASPPRGRVSPTTYFCSQRVHTDACHVISLLPCVQASCAGGQQHCRCAAPILQLISSHLCCGPPHQHACHHDRDVTRTVGVAAHACSPLCCPQPCQGQHAQPWHPAH